jgi:hypothetical protein
MKVNIDIDDKHTEPSITIQTNEWSDELEEILAIIKRKNSQRLFGTEADQILITFMLKKGKYLRVLKNVMLKFE